MNESSEMLLLFAGSILAGISLGWFASKFADWLEQHERENENARDWFC